MNSIRTALLALALLAMSGGAMAGDREKQDRAAAAEANTSLGLTYMSQGKLQDAKEKIEKALGQNPKSATTQQAAGFLYDRLGDDKKARSHYEQAVKLAGDSNPEVINNYAVFLCRKGDKKLGEKYFLEAAQNALYRTPEAAYSNAGRCARADGRPKDAEPYFRKALAIRPEFPDALVQMAELTFEAGNAFQARAFLQRYMAVATATAESLWIGYRIEKSMGDEQAAREYADRLKREFPTSEQTTQLFEAEKG
jgi:type IV pilus assembly protein PilF